MPRELPRHEPSAGEEGGLGAQRWAAQRRLEDVFTKLGEKFGDLAGRVSVTVKPDTSFDSIGHLKPELQLEHRHPSHPKLDYARP